jgi:hypothetical protein
MPSYSFVWYELENGRRQQEKRKNREIKTSYYRKQTSGKMVMMKLITVETQQRHVNGKSVEVKKFGIP